MLIQLLLTALLQSPNILLILTDDQGIDLVQSYGVAFPQETPTTPNIDALAAQGIRFTRAYSNPVCSPARATLLTGRYPFRTGIGAIIPKNTTVWLDYGETTIPEVLDPQGYTSVWLGKWHLGDHLWPLDPIAHGFDAFSGTRANTSDYYQHQMAVSAPWMFAQFQNTTYSTTRTTDDAITAVDCLLEPWFVLASYHAPHEPLHVPPPELQGPGPFDTDLQKVLSATLALDTEIGRLLSHVNLSNTVVVFVGDNGTDGWTSVSTPTRSKATLFEAGVRVPLIVAGAGVAQGAVSSSLVHVVDLFATVAELGGASSSAEDSVSFVPILTDPQAVTRTTVYSECLQPLTGPPYDEQDEQMLLDDRWKLIRTNPPQGGFIDKFYDLSVWPFPEDRQNLCPCPNNLSPEELAGYNHLSTVMSSIR